MLEEEENDVKSDASAFKNEFECPGKVLVEDFFTPPSKSIA